MISGETVHCHLMIKIEWLDIYYVLPWKQLQPNDDVYHQPKYQLADRCWRLRQPLVRWLISNSSAQWTHRQDKSLQWNYMSVMVSELTSNSVVCSKSSGKRRNFKPRVAGFCKGNLPMTGVVSPSKAMWKVSLYHDVATWCCRTLGLSESSHSTKVMKLDIKAMHKGLVGKKTIRKDDTSL